MPLLSSLEPPVLRSITYQSQDIDFQEWITLLTLCLAPLIAHIVAGTPSPSYLCNNRPKWHESICHYNPTSILWRYAAITDRRIRAKSWDRAEMAATNAVFWTTRGWDGSEAMINQSISHCVHLPDHARITIFSREMIVTLIVTFQGIQAIILLTSAFVGSGLQTTFTLWMAVDIIFFPLEFIGLLRLCCGLWISDDFTYSAAPATDLDYASQSVPLSRGRSSFDSFLERPSSPHPSRFRETFFWPSRLFRILFLLPILGMATMAILFGAFGGEFTATTLVAIVFYLMFLVATTIILLHYFFGGHTTTTIIPCINSTWYKAYTGIVAGLAVVLIVVSCLETRRTPCGKYTSGQGPVADLYACQGDKIDSAVPLSQDPDWEFFGLVAHVYEEFSNGSYGALIPGEQHVYNFTGMCLGNLIGYDWGTE